jgi:hypothetical protein
MAFRKIEAGLVHADVDEFIGKTGTIFYDNDLGDFRISDGVTPGGIALSFGGGGGGGNYTLPTATTTTKGGVKIDGTTITIANQVISIGTVPYSSLSGTPTIPTNTNQLTNGAGYITSGALSGYATESYVTGRGYITSSSLTGLATESYVTSRGYITSSALSGYALTSAIPTNNNQLTNGAAYITSAALSGYALTSAIPTDISQLADSQGLLGQGGGGGGGTTYITNNVANPFSFSIAGDDSTLREIANGESIKITGAGGITVTTDAEGNVTVTGTPVSLAGYATESYVTSRGYITGLSFNDLTDKPNLAGTYTFNVAADDSTLRTIGTEETVKFVGAGGITTSSDTEGAITITQGTTSSLVNGANTVSLGSDGVLTIPPNGLIIASTGPLGQQHEMRLGDGLTIGQGGSLANYRNETWTLYGQNSDAGTQIRLPGQVDSDNGLSLLIQHNFANSSIDIESLGNIWSFRYDGALTFPDTTVQITAWTGVADYNNLINKPNLAGTYQFSVAADDSTQRLISTDEVIKFTGAGGITTASDAEGNITITGPSLAGLATETFVTTQGYITSSALTGLATESYVTSRGYITGLSYNDLTDKPNLAGTYSWSIAADDSTQLEISAGNLVKIVGTRGVTTSSNADGQITITGPDLSSYATQSYVTTALSNSGIVVSATAPTGQPEGKLWYNSASLELYVRYDNTWVAASASFSGDYNDLTNKPTNVSQFANDAGYVSRDEVYLMILELAG